MPGEVSPPDLEIVQAQTLIAFGQGAGAIPSAEACEVLRKHFGPLLGKSAGRWSDVQPLVLEHARQLGRIATALSSAAGCTAIEAEHVGGAIRRMHPSKERFALVLCPIC